MKERTVRSLNSMTITTTYVKHSNKWYKLLEFEGEDLQSIKEYKLKPAPAQ
jgi:hypothetical protein